MTSIYFGAWSDVEPFVTRRDKIKQDKIKGVSDSRLEGLRFEDTWVVLRPELSTTWSAEQVSDL